MSDPRELAAVVRDGAHFYMAHQYREPPDEDVAHHVPEGCKGCAAEAALDALVAECERYKREMNESYAAVQHASDLQDEAEARAEAAEWERDEHREASAITIRKMGEALDRSQARARRYEEALRIADTALVAMPKVNRYHQQGVNEVLGVIRAALAEEKA